MLTFFTDTLAYISSLCTILWLNVISFEIWYTSSKPLNAERDHKIDRRRLIFYTIYTNGMVLVVTILRNYSIGKYSVLSEIVWEQIPMFFFQFNFSDTSWYTMSTVGVVLLVLMLNLITFIFLSVYICRTRLRVARMMNTRNFTRDL